MGADLPQPSLRVALVREGLLTAEAALDEVWPLPFHRRVAALCLLLPALPEALVPLVVAHTRGEEWDQQAATHHVGAWVAGQRGGDRLLGDLVGRLAEHGALEQSMKVLARIQHIDTRVRALLGGLRDQIAPDRWRELRTETLEMARVEPSDNPETGVSAANVRAVYGMCAASKLFGNPDAVLQIVREAVARLPPAGTRNRWTHYPGGLMLVPLAQPVLDALERVGLTDEIARIAADGETEFTEWLTDGWDPVSDALEAWQKSRDGTWLPAAISTHLEHLPDAHLEEALQMTRRGLDAEPGHLNWILGLGVLARRLDGDGATELLRAHLATHAEAIEWERQSHHNQIWNVPMLFDLLDPGHRRAVLRAALARLQKQG